MNHTDCKCTNLKTTEVTLKDNTAQKISFCIDCGKVHNDVNKIKPQVEQTHVKRSWEQIKKDHIQRNKKRTWEDIRVNRLNKKSDSTPQTNQTIVDNVEPESF